MRKGNNKNEAGTYVILWADHSKPFISELRFSFQSLYLDTLTPNV